MLLVIYVVFVRTVLGQEVDEAALVGADYKPQGLITEAWHLLDTIGVSSLAAATLVIAAVAVARRRYHLAVAATVAIGLVMVTAPRWRSTIAALAGLYPIAIGIAVVAAGSDRPDPHPTPAARRTTRYGGGGTRLHLVGSRHRGLAPAGDTDDGHRAARHRRGEIAGRPTLRSDSEPR